MLNKSDNSNCPEDSKVVLNQHYIHTHESVSTCFFRFIFKYLQILQFSVIMISIAAYLYSDSAFFFLYKTACEKGSWLLSCCEYFRYKYFKCMSSYLSSYFGIKYSLIISYYYCIMNKRWSHLGKQLAFCGGLN